jgi:hypothetical protein
MISADGQLSELTMYPRNQEEYLKISNVMGIMLWNGSSIP